MNITCVLVITFNITDKRLSKNKTSTLSNIADCEQTSHTPGHGHQMHVEQILKMQISLYIALAYEMEKGKMKKGGKKKMSDFIRNFKFLVPEKSLTQISLCFALK